MAGTSKPDDPKPDDPELPRPLPEFPELDPVPDDGTPADHGGAISGRCALRPATGHAVEGPECMSDIPYPDTPQPDIPVPTEPDIPTPIPEVEPDPGEGPDLPPEPSEPPGDDVPKVG